MSKLTLCPTLVERNKIPIFRVLCQVSPVSFFRGYVTTSNILNYFAGLRRFLHNISPSKMSYLNRASSWLLTPSGKQFCYYAAGVGSTCVMLGHMLPHTILIDQYEDLWRLYRNGFSVPLSKAVLVRFEKALDLAGIHEADKHLFKPFAAYGFDIFSIGSSMSRFGVRVGIPTHFLYEDEQSVDKSGIKIRDQSVIWDLEEGHLLLQSLVLSENAQVYAMAKEIKLRDNMKVLIDTVFATMSCIGCYGLSSGLNAKLDLYRLPRGWRVTLYLLAGMLSLGTYATCKDFTTVYFEEKIDKELKQKDPILREGGKEFYTKLSERNIALRRLLGKEGERTFTALGNFNYFFRHKRLPIVERKMFFEQPLST